MRRAARFHGSWRCNEAHSIRFVPRDCSETDSARDGKCSSLIIMFCWVLSNELIALNCSVQCEFYSLAVLSQRSLLRMQTKSKLWIQNSRCIYSLSISKPHAEAEKPTNETTFCLAFATRTERKSNCERKNGDGNLLIIFFPFSGLLL